MNTRQELVSTVIKQASLPVPSVQGLVSDAQGEYLPWDEIRNGVRVLIPPQPNGSKGDSIAAFFLGYNAQALLDDPSQEQLITIGEFPFEFDPGTALVYYLNLTSGAMSEFVQLRVENYAPRVRFVGVDGAIPIDAANNGLTIEVSKYYRMKAGDRIQVVVDETPVSLGFVAQRVLTQEAVDTCIYIEYPKTYTQTLPGKDIKMRAVLKKVDEVRCGEYLNIYAMRKVVPVTAAVPSWLELDELYEEDPDLNLGWYLYPLVEDIEGVLACRMTSRVNQAVERGSRVVFYLFGQGETSFTQTVVLEEPGPGYVSFVVPEPYLYFSAGAKTAIVVVELADGTAISSGLMTWVRPDSTDAATVSRRPLYKRL